jgi:cytochrome c-type biogenesis protein CcmF
MLKVWNIVLVIMSYVHGGVRNIPDSKRRCELGPRLAKSPIGGYFLAFIVIALSGSFYLLIDRLPHLKNENQMGSVVSRESSFLFNNLVLLVACFSVLFGTMLRRFQNGSPATKITVSKPFFDAVDVPIAIFLLFLTGVGPLLAWRKASTNSLEAKLHGPDRCRIAHWSSVACDGCAPLLRVDCLVMAAFVGHPSFESSIRARGHDRWEPAKDSSNPS